MEIPWFARGSYQNRSPIAINERTVNRLVERIEVENQKARWILLPTPGFSQFNTSLLTGGVRGVFTTASRTFVVVAGKWYEFASDGSAIDRSTVPVSTLDSQPATIAANGAGGNEVFFSAGDRGYNYDLGTNVLSEVLTSGVHMVASLDGFFIALNNITSTIRISNLFDGTTWSGTQMFQRTAAGDRWLALLVADKRIYLIGELTSETFTNTGASPFPFEADTIVIPFGTPARYSVADALGSVVFLAQNADGLAGVVRLNGLSAEKISHYALDVALGGYAAIADAIGDTCTIDGHTLYVLTFPTQNVSWAYDLTTNVWVEIGHWDPANNRYDAWRPIFHTYNFGKHLMGDRTVGKLWRMSPTLTTDVDGAGIRWLRQFPGSFEQHKLLFYDRFEVLTEPGLVGAGADTPDIELEYANDGGKLWHNAGLATLGQQGQYDTRAYWTNLGSGRQRMWRLTGSDNAAYRLIGCYQDVRAGLEVRS